MKISVDSNEIYLLKDAVIMDVPAISRTDFSKYGCVKCNSNSRYIKKEIYHRGTRLCVCKSCSTTFIMLSDGMTKSSIGLGDNEGGFLYPRLVKHPLRYNIFRVMYNRFMYPLEHFMPIQITDTGDLIVEVLPETVDQILYIVEKVLGHYTISSTIPDIYPLLTVICIDSNEFDTDLLRKIADDSGCSVSESILKKCVKKNTRCIRSINVDGFEYINSITRAIDINIGCGSQSRIIRPIRYIDDNITTQITISGKIVGHIKCDKDYKITEIALDANTVEDEDYELLTMFSKFIGRTLVFAD